MHELCGDKIQLPVHHKEPMSCPKRDPSYRMPRSHCASAEQIQTASFLFFLKSLVVFVRSVQLMNGIQHALVVFGLVV